MKKSVKFAIGALIMILVVLGVIIINVNKEKIPITASSFDSSMKQKGYSIINANSQFSEYDYVKQVYIAASKDYKYQIEFYELLNDSYATMFYNNNKAIFESLKQNTAVETNVSLKNYSKYTLSSNEKYMVVSRIDNTVIYVKVDDEYKDAVKAMLDELGY